jgi:hypothetical protein
MASIFLECFNSKINDIYSIVPPSMCSFVNGRGGGGGRTKLDQVSSSIERNHQWTRVSEDNKSSNFSGEQLLTLCGAFDLVICNGVARWANFGISPTIPIMEQV